MSITSFYTFKNPNLYNLPVKSEFKFLKRKNKNTFNQEFDTLLFEENIRKMIFTGILKIIIG